MHIAHHYNTAVSVTLQNRVGFYLRPSYREKRPSIFTFAAITARQAILPCALCCKEDERDGDCDGDVAEDCPSVVDITTQFKLN